MYNNTVIYVGTGSLPCLSTELNVFGSKIPITSKSDTESVGIPIEVRNFVYENSCTTISFIVCDSIYEYRIPKPKILFEKKCLKNIRSRQKSDIKMMIIIIYA